MRRPGAVRTTVTLCALSTLCALCAGGCPDPIRQRQQQQQQQPGQVPDAAPPGKPGGGLRPDQVAAAELLVGLSFKPDQRKLMLGNLRDQRQAYARLRGVKLANARPPALWFEPLPPAAKPPTVPPRRFRPPPDGQARRPAELEQLAFAPVTRLAALLRARKVTSLELTRMFLARLERHDPELEAVVTLTRELALRQARKADAELAAGRYRGPLHGVPYGVKDLLDTRGIRTTWGARPFKDRVPAKDATVVRRLEQAGAVLVAKLSVGALAWGDVWFGGKTRNPWNPKQGASGSSAGPAAATAAGLVPFAIGTETWGSIVSPATRCGVTGLRPTFGRVSRAGAMTLAWSMDKIGPICRAVEDCALVLEAIQGPDGEDPTVRAVPLGYDRGLRPGRLRVGYLPALFARSKAKHGNDARSLAKLRALGWKLVPLKLPDLPVKELAFLLSAEAAAAFDDLTRSGRDALLVRQVKDAWPNVFRAARLIPAVEYLQANRVRQLWIEAMPRVLESVDVYVAPTSSDNLLLTNLTGHPCVCVPNGLHQGSPTSITFCGRLFGEAAVLAVARRYQEATGYHLARPPRFDPARR
jgi:Asp-tRNA(Asn)/Glu-tRNA(Gln) amidotransferase A subunit family amidase